LAANNQGCITRDSINVVFDPVPQLELGDTKGICDGEEAQLTAGVTGDSYTWNTGATSPDISVGIAGNYTLTVVAGACIITDDVEVVVSTFPVIDLGNDTLLCEGQQLQLESIQDPTYDLQWQDGSTDNNFTVSSEGTYTLSANNQGCITNDEIEVSFQVAPILNLGADRQACEADVVSLTTDVNVDTYNWNTGATTSDIDITETGNYSVTVTQGVCQREDDININFNAYPIVDFGTSDTSICDKEVLTLRTPQEGVWQDGSTADVYNATQPGLYHVLLSNNGCETRDSVNLSIRALPEIDLGQDQTLCDGESTTISAPGQLAEFSWEDGSDDASREITTSGTYWLEAVANNCPNRDSVNIQFNALPTLSLGRDTTVCSDLGYEINAIASDGVITWPDGSTGEQFNVTSPGLISATIDNGCTSEADVNINFRECFYFNMYVPNAFNPTSRNGNQLFRPTISRGVQIISYEMNIFNRWGNLMFSTQSPDEGWNGYINDVNSKTSVYVYQVDITYQDDNGIGEEQVAGDVLLVE